MNSKPKQRISDDRKRDNGEDRYHVWLTPEASKAMSEIQALTHSTNRAIFSEAILMLRSKYN